MTKECIYGLVLDTVLCGVLDLTSVTRDIGKGKRESNKELHKVATGI